MYTLYNKHLYSNPDFDYIKSGIIKEYDIKAAGLNMLIAANLLTDKQISYYNSLDKKKRNVKIGLLERDKKYSKAISENLKKYRKLFFEANNIDENKVLSIRRDAIFLVNSKISKTKFDNVEFVAKNRYSSYYQINNCDYLFDKRNNRIDVKGIDDDILKYHKNYMLKFMRKLFSLNEISNRSACDYLYDFAYRYKKRLLEKDYYREINSDLFRLKKLKLNGNSIGILDADINDIDINYNYSMIIVPLINMIF